MYTETIYILLSTYTKQDVYFFRDSYIKGFEPLSTYYEYPPSLRAKNEFETENADEMIDFMLQGDKGYFRFYFEPPNPAKIYKGMIFFNHDNTLVLGISVDSEYTEEYQEKLKKDFRSELVLIMDEFPPPSTAKDFIELRDSL